MPTATKDKPATRTRTRTTPPVEKSTLSIELPKELRDRLTTAANRAGIARGRIIERGLERYLDVFEKRLDEFESNADLS